MTSTTLANGQTKRQGKLFSSLPIGVASCRPIRYPWGEVTHICGSLVIPLIFSLEFVSLFLRRKILVYFQIGSSTLTRCFSLSSRNGYKTGR